jgi:hypothetical protein
MSFAKTLHAHLLFHVIVLSLLLAQSPLPTLSASGIEPPDDSLGSPGHLGKSCTDLKQKKVNKSGFYWVKPIETADTIYKVYCEMSTFGGGWALVAHISNQSRDHLNSNSAGCDDDTDCGIKPERDIPATRKLDDSVIRALANEGIFRVDVFEPKNNTIFFQIVSGSANFNSSCKGKGCPRIVTSRKFPYEWESNCKGRTVGYRVKNNYSVFDNHDDGECGRIWKFSNTTEDRVVYGHPTSNGICPCKEGHMYVS